MRACALNSRTRSARSASAALSTRMSSKSANVCPCKLDRHSMARSGRLKVGTMTLIVMAVPRYHIGGFQNVPRIRQLFEIGADRMLGPLGYQLHDKVLSERPEGFPGYLEAAQQAGM